MRQCVLSRGGRTALYTCSLPLSGEIGWKVFQETRPPLMDDKFYHGGCGQESGSEDKPASVAVSSWRPQQVEGKWVATIQPDATFPAGA